MTPQGDIRGLKDLIHIPYPFYYYLIGGALAVGLVLLVAALVRKFLRKRVRPPKAAPPPRPLHELILQELSDLRDHYNEGTAAEKKFHFLLSEIFRRYLEGRYLFAATDSTTEEILARLPGLSPFTETQRTSLARLLRETDMVKFAAGHKTREEALALVVLAETFVRETTPTEGGAA